MLFNSFQYLFFLWTVYLLWWTWSQRRSWRMSMVLVASYWFYAQADWRFCSLLMISTAVDFLAGHRIAAAAKGTGARRLWLWVSVASNLGMLGFFKYFDFFVDGFEALFASFGSQLDLWHLSAARGGPLDFIVPAGISFYTFQTLSYTIDVYRGKMKPCESWLDFAVYVSFFPQLVAGPIVRAVDFLPQVANPAPFDRERVSSGIFQILRGLAKKLLMADVLGVYLVDVAFRNDPEAGLTIRELGGPTFMIAVYAYALQLYGDFAGYSDIAIGSARLLGFDLRKNFDAPFKSKSLEEFWTRWHISMSSWFMDYVYVGLGGSRVSMLKVLRNVLVAWTLVGLWHGAAWTFVLWGFYHGAWLCLVRLVRLALPGGKLPKNPVTSVLGTLFAFHVVAFSMIIFRSADMGDLQDAVAVLFDWSIPLRPLPTELWIVLVVGYVTHFLPERVTLGLEAAFGRLHAAGQGLVIAGAILCFYALAPPEAPFIYFQF